MTPTPDTVLAEHAARVAAQAQATALFLDFDGTLAPIVDDPNEARPLPWTVELLGQLAARFAAVALLSGRPADYLAEHAAAPGVRYLGLYGLQEIRDGQLWVDPRLEAARLAVKAAQQDLRDSAAVRDSGAYLEDKQYTVAIHTRRVADADRWAAPIDASSAANRREARAGSHTRKAGLGATPRGAQRQRRRRSSGHCRVQGPRCRRGRRRPW